MKKLFRVTLKSKSGYYFINIDFIRQTVKHKKSNKKINVNNKSTEQVNRPITNPPPHVRSPTRIPPPNYHWQSKSKYLSKIITDNGEKWELLPNLEKPQKFHSSMASSIPASNALTFSFLHKRTQFLTPSITHYKLHTPNPLPPLTLQKGTPHFSLNPLFLSPPSTLRAPATKNSENTLINNELNVTNIGEKPLKTVLWVLFWTSVSLAVFAFSKDAKAAVVSVVASDSSIKASSFGVKVASFMRGSGWADEVIVFALATLPVIELRGAIPVGYWMQLKPTSLTVLSILGWVIVDLCA